MEFVRLIVFTHKGFHNTDSLDVFLDGFIQCIVLRKTRLEQRHCDSCDNVESDSEHWYYRKEDHRHCSAHVVRHRKRENQIERRPDRCTDDHHERHLNILDICC